VIAVLFSAQQVHQDLTPFEVDAKAHFAEALGLHGAAQVRLALLGTR
jgi:hypothetical protein